MLVVSKIALLEVVVVVVQELNGASVSIWSFPRVGASVVFCVSVLARARAIAVVGAVSGAATLEVGVPVVVVVTPAAVVVAIQE